MYTHHHGQSILAEWTRDESSSPGLTNLKYRHGRKSRWRGSASSSAWGKEAKCLWDLGRDPVGPTPQKLIHYKILTAAAFAPTIWTNLEQFLSKDKHITLNHCYKNSCNLVERTRWVGHALRMKDDRLPKIDCRAIVYHQTKSRSSSNGAGGRHKERFKGSGNLFRGCKERNYE